MLALFGSQTNEWHEKKCQVAIQTQETSMVFGTESTSKNKPFHRLRLLPSSSRDSILGQKRCREEEKLAF